MSNSISISPEQLVNSSIYQDEYIEKEWNGLRVVVRRLIGVSDMISIVDNIMNACVTDKGVFVPEMIDFATRANIILAYSNVLLPKDIEEQYRILYATDIYECVYKEINKGQYDSIVKAVDILSHK